ncbi:group II intron reverse transcriptase domain-containing protein [bacterium]|nr:group II intron reverse transcriptase domain-containing protein [bacterium]
MKRIGNLFNHAFTKDALLQAFYDASKSKRNKRACFDFEKNLGTQIDMLYEELHNGLYKPRTYYKFIVREPKTRTIYAPAFRDCVVQHAIYRIISPIFERTFIQQSFACRVGYGTHKAANYAQNALQNSSEDSYTLKLDIRKFFYRINRTILRTQIERKIKDVKFVELMMLFSDHGELIGIPIGNLLSQLYALIYLNPLDHFIKRVLKIKKYCRYVDDFILFNITKVYAVECRIKIVSFIKKHLCLELSKSTISSTIKGVNFVGYRTWKTKRLIRKHCLYNFKQAVKKVKIDSVTSILGHSKLTHSLQYLIKFIQRSNYALYNKLPEVYK